MTQPVLAVLELALAIGVPALIALLAPRGWRFWAILLWALAPVLVGLAVAGGELASGKASTADIDKLVFGLLLIGSFLLLPWLMACGVGFTIGAIVRGRMAGKPVVAPTPPSPPQPEEAATPPAPLPQSPEPIVYAPAASGPSLSPPSGWHAAHVGFESDGLVLDGLDIWSLTWREEEEGARVMLAHPAHLAEQHAFTVYNADDGARATRFAAAELSNGVWGFYRWIVPADAASGESADASLRYEHDLGPFVDGRYDAAPTARLYDARSGALLFDGGGWQSSRIVPQADASLLLSLDQGELQTLLRIDPGAGLFRDLATAGAERPLAELADAAATARAACDDPANTYLGRRVAPDGSLVVDLQAVEWSNTHWVRSPRVTQVASGRVLLDLWGTDWDAWPSFPRAGTVRLSFRRYRSGGQAQVELELEPERYVLYEGAGAVFGPLADLPQALEDLSRRATAQAPSRPAAPPRPTLRSWLVALLILAGAAGLIAAATLVTLRLQGPPPPQRLDTIPPMPGER